MRKKSCARGNESDLHVESLHSHALPVGRISLSAVIMKIRY